MVTDDTLDIPACQGCYDSGEVDLWMKRKDALLSYKKPIPGRG